MSGALFANGEDRFRGSRAEKSVSTTTRNSSGLHSEKSSTRLVGLAVLRAVVHSEALFHPLSHFAEQVSHIVPALLAPLFYVDIETLNHE